MKLTNKESVKQIILIITGILLMCVGYFNYSMFSSKRKYLDCDYVSFIFVKNDFHDGK